MLMMVLILVCDDAFESLVFDVEKRQIVIKLQHPTQCCACQADTPVLAKMSKLAKPQTGKCPRYLHQFFTNIKLCLNQNHHNEPKSSRHSDTMWSIVPLKQPLVTCSCANLIKLFYLRLSQATRYHIPDHLHHLGHLSPGQAPISLSHTKKIKLK